MINFLSPLWLILLGFLPLIRWLHRFRQQASISPTTSLFLWKKIQHQAHSDGSPSTPDPRWLLRALIFTLWVIILAEPVLESHNKQTIEVWLDDSLSLFTSEGRQQRMQLGLQQLHHYLNEGDYLKIQLHSLGNPATTLTLDPDNKANWLTQLRKWTSQPGGEPSPPPLATLSPDHKHILFTDGADKRLNQWAVLAPLEKIIQTGQADINIALTRLSLRKAIDGSKDIKGLAKINNLSNTSQEIQFLLQQNKQIRYTQKLKIPAMGEAIIHFLISLDKQGKLEARIISSNDSLQLDNVLQLDIKSLYLPLRYKKYGQCGQFIHAILNSHPAFMLVDDQAIEKKADLLIDCTDKNHATTLPTLKFHPQNATLQTQHPAHWHININDSLQLRAGLAYSESAPALTSAGIPILSADNRLLVMQHRSSPQVIDSYLDHRDPNFTRQTEFPLLILELIKQLTGRELLLEPLSVHRDLEASRIKTIPLPITPQLPKSDQVGETQTNAMLYTSALLLLSLLLLLLDAALAFNLKAALFHRHEKQQQ